MSDSRPFHVLFSSKSSVILREEYSDSAYEAMKNTI